MHSVFAVSVNLVNSRLAAFNIFDKELSRMLCTCIPVTEIF